MCSNLMDIIVTSYKISLTQKNIKNKKSQVQCYGLVEDFDTEQNHEKLIQSLGELWQV